MAASIGNDCINVKLTMILTTYPVKYGSYVKGDRI